MKTPEELSLDDLGSVVGGAEGTRACFVYTIGKGDCLSVIAHRYGCTVAELQELNHFTNPNLIYEGLRILVPYNA